MTAAAVLALADGRCFWGRALGAEGQATGEVVFNTAMTGYQEILTDPSYCRQLVTLTYPHIGNVGCNEHDAESDRVHAAGLIIRDEAKRRSNWRAGEDLGSYLKRHGTVGISELDTRALTRALRDGGAQPGCILSGPGVTAEAAIAAARATADLKGQDLAKVVSTAQPYRFAEGSHDLASDRPQSPGEQRFRVVAYDFGIKRNILRLLVDQGCDVMVVPAQSSAAQVLAAKPDGVFLSNGPGDPEPCTYAIEAIAELLAAGIPIFGICLGHQLLGLALGARTEKMKFGHHGANHPVLEIDSGRVLITSQNHGFAVDEASLPARARATHRSLFDQTLQGLEVTDAPAFSFQGHPEASPGPHDLAELFGRFAAMMSARKGVTAPA
ncbi:MAG: glutamine-hydrolyzing carbamoyl-phosphate synthase small subunit [Xanthomonadales bacterium]|nr:glutamine-hydrolyzing carbamoyl-phosphate synthase small subunit [Xanthomonadales bacterium]